MNMSKRDKIAGAVYGFAIGDAMGATTEFMTRREIKKIYGKVTNIIGGGWLGLKPGEVTDDTEMTLCVIDAIMMRPKDVKEFVLLCENNFIDWLNSNPKDIGGQCHRAISDLRDFHKGAKVNEAALGNGSLMRAMPLAILGLGSFNVAQGMITHNNSTCSKVILSYTELIQTYLHDIPNNGYRYGVKRLSEPSGHVLNTFNNSVYWSNEKSFKKAVLGAVNDGGDADTIAAITGSLAGAKFGYKNIPKKWVDKINPEVKAHLDAFLDFAYICLQI